MKSSTCVKSENEIEFANVSRNFNFFGKMLLCSAVYARCWLQHVCWLQVFLDRKRLYLVTVRHCVIYSMLLTLSQTLTTDPKW